MNDLAKIPTRYKERIWENRCFKWKVNNGELVSIKTDCWHGSSPLSCSHTHLFKASNHKYASVKDMKILWKAPNFEELWNKELSGYERLDSAYLGTPLDNVHLTNKDDSLQWLGMNKFSTSLCYSKLKMANCHNGSWYVIWKLKIPPKVKIFLWQWGHNSIHSWQFLRSRGLLLNSTCKTCLLAEESQDHILWWCPFAIDMWTNCSAWLKVDPTPQASSNLDGYFC